MGLVASALLLVISVDYATAAAAARPGSDREDVSGTLTRNDGVADDNPLTINLIDDADAELDGPGTIQLGYFSGGPIKAREANRIGEFPLFRTRTVRQVQVSVHYRLGGGTATAGVDFVRLRRGRSTWADGECCLKTHSTYN